ncbi:hypothetical protein N8371_09375 [Vicingaceae bacterium]|nr:hypothetical protein [Vicingaceae bacterium]MDC1452596.1 hypothetical protein [Vicingaceae bacterium]
MVIPFGVGIFIGLNFSQELTPAIIASFIGFFLGLVLLHLFNRNFKTNYLTGILITAIFIGLGIGYSSIHTTIETRGLHNVPTNTAWLGRIQTVKQIQVEVKSLVVQIQKFKNNDLWEDGNFKLLV